MNAIEIAIRMETDAIKFYREASEKVQNTVGKKMFLSIMEDEKRHLDMLREIFKGLEITVLNVSPMKNIRTIFEEFKEEMMNRVTATNDELESFRIAMTMEKEGMEFYRKQAKEAVSPKEQALFERLVKEEEEHHAVFANTYSFLKDTGNWYLWEEHSIVDGGTPWA
ncbi:MAG: ferritin family protein [Candidatus Dadabacteria bacterium]|nr:MAG: ferritin family protein [Candidatus Dadabacteria bacterium]